MTYEIEFGATIKLLFDAHPKFTHIQVENSAIAWTKSN